MTKTHNLYFHPKVGNILFETNRVSGKLVLLSTQRYPTTHSLFHPIFRRPYQPGVKLDDSNTGFLWMKVGTKAKILEMGFIPATKANLAKHWIVRDTDE